MTAQIRRECCLGSDDHLAVAASTAGRSPGHCGEQTEEPWIPAVRYVFHLGASHGSIFERLTSAPWRTRPERGQEVRRLSEATSEAEVTTVGVQRWTSTLGKGTLCPDRGLCPPAPSHSGA